MTTLGAATKESLQGIRDDNRGDSKLAAILALDVKGTPRPVWPTNCGALP
jgi:hypothetical protein